MDKKKKIFAVDENEIAATSEVVSKGRTTQKLKKKKDGSLIQRLLTKIINAGSFEVHVLLLPVAVSKGVVFLGPELYKLFEDYLQDFHFTDIKLGTEGDYFNGVATIRFKDRADYKNAKKAILDANPNLVLMKDLADFKNAKEAISHACPN